jgi:hypothetical protein
VNGDGYSDVIVGAYGNTSYAGKAYLYLGGPSGLSAAAWTASGQAAGDYFGHSVAAAGDVNGDGYSDVIIGACYANSYAGKAYLYLGGPSGLTAASAWVASGEATGNFFGVSVAPAGDVNGDGYSDVVVGANAYANYAGKAYLYLGGPSGLSAADAWTASGETVSSQFGYSVGTAGDVNGDGYSDVIVGAYSYHPGSTTGKAYLYLGGPSGLSAAAAWTAWGEDESNYFGYSIAAAGDVNGDGYSDVIVGAYGNTGFTGRAYLYLGGLSGLSSPSAWTASGEAETNDFGCSVATAGDVNGDGYSDVIVGALGNNGNAGRAYLFFGGGGPGVPYLPRQRQSDTLKNIPPLGASSNDELLVSLLPRSPFGRGKAKIEWQVEPLQTTITAAPGDYVRGTGWWNTGSGTPVTGLPSDLPAGVWHWRARLLYRPSSVPWLPASRWFHIPGAALQEGHFRVFGPMGCVPPDEPCWLYSVVKNGTDYTLNWQDPNQSDQRTGWNIRRSNNAALPKSSWPLVGTNVVDMDQIAPNYQWTDHSGADPGPGGVWYYQVTTYNANCPAEGPF